MTKAYFSQIESVITESIERAEKSVHVAVAWFTNKRLYNLLLDKLSEGIVVELIIRDDHINNSDSDASLRWGEFMGRGGRLYFPQTAQTMHNKFCILDGSIVITGSYNWTYQAELANQENIITVESRELAESFGNHFIYLKESCLLVEDIAELNRHRVSSATEVEREYINLEQRMAVGTPDFKETLLMAEDLYCHKKYEEAATLLQQVISSDRSQSTAYRILASVRFRQGQFAEQLKLAELGLSLEANNSDFHNLIGLAQRELGDYREAIRSFDNAIRLSPEDTDYYINKYDALFESRQESASEDAARKLIEVGTNVIRKSKEKDYSPYFILKTHINRGLARLYKIDRLEAASKAMEIFESLPEEKRDYHDLDQINLLKTI